MIAIENVRLFDEVQARTRELSESLDQQTATADVLKVISRSTFDLKSVLQTLVESAGHLCNADFAMITRQKDGVLFFAEAYGYSGEFVEHVRALPVERGRGTATREPRRIDRGPRAAAANPAQPPRKIRPGTRPLLAGPHATAVLS